MQTESTTSSTGAVPATYPIGAACGLRAGAHGWQDVPATTTPAAAFDVRKVGERWLSAYWGQVYTVLATCPTGITVKWADGHTGSHATPLSRGDRRVS